MIHNESLKTYLNQFPVEQWREQTYPVDPSVLTRFKQKLEQADVIIIDGDYDVDGICASYILEKGIKACYPDKGVSVLLPDRFRNGYGIQQSQIDKISHVLRQVEEQKGEPIHPLLITCDNGIGAVDTLDYARKTISNLSIVITDHHLPTEIEYQGKREIIYPDADMILDPKCPNQTVFAFDSYCGAGICYKLMDALCADKGLPVALREELCLYAGIATVCDMVPMVEDNWKITRASLDFFRNGFQKRKLPEALRYLCDVYEIADSSQIDEGFYGFKLGPTLNAMGRLQDYGAMRVLRYLRNPTTDEAHYLFTNNEMRKGMVATMTETLVEQVKRRERKDPLAPIWVYIPGNKEGAEEGLCGLYAQQLADIFHAPAIVCTNSRVHPEIVKGSGRSIEGFHLHAYLQENAKEYLLSFGGHKEACGCSCTLDQLKALAKDPKIYEWKPFYHKETESEQHYLPFDGISNMIADYQEMKNTYAPFGVDYQKPLYALELDSSIQRFATMGEGKHFYTKIKDGDKECKVIHFQHKDSDLLCPENFMVYGEIAENYYKNHLYYQFIAKEIGDTKETLRLHEQEIEEDLERD